jgi:elongation factor Ts
MSVTAQMVNILRQKTGAAMNMCKKALVSTNGDQEKAEHWLRVQLPSHKPVEKLSGEGAIIIAMSADKTKAALVELTCDTDFTARNERFLNLGQVIAETLLNNPVSKTEEVLALPLGTSTLTIGEAINAEITLGFKENIKLSYHETHAITGGKLGSYTHSNKKLAVIVGAHAPTSVDDATLESLLKDLSMHIAGTPTAPIAVSRSDVPLEMLETELNVITDQFNSDPKNATKPSSIKEKIISGKLNKFYGEKTLLEQPFVKDETKTVAQHIASVSKDIKITTFTRRQIGQ